MIHIADQAAADINASSDKIVLNRQAKVSIVGQDEQSTILPEMEQPPIQHDESVHSAAQPSTFHRCHPLRGGQEYKVP